MSAAPIPPQFSALLDDDEAVATVLVEGELDLDTADSFDAVAAQALATGRPVVFDFTACTFMDSTGLQRVLRHREAASRAEQGLVLAIPPAGPVSRLVDLVAPGLFRQAGTVAEARAIAQQPGA